MKRIMALRKPVSCASKSENRHCRFLRTLRGLCPGCRNAAQGEKIFDKQEVIPLLLPQIMAEVSAWNVL